MLVLLLDKAADPKLALDDALDSLIPWEHFLGRCSKYFRRGEWEAWPHAKLLVKAGADPDVSLMKRRISVQQYRRSARHSLVPNIASTEQCISKIHKQSAAPEVLVCPQRGQNDEVTPT